MLIQFAKHLFIILKIVVDFIIQKFYDSPLGWCAGVPITTSFARQKTGMKLTGYPEPFLVRKNDFVILSNEAGHGQITNGTDIRKKH